MARHSHSAIRVEWVDGLIIPPPSFFPPSSPSSSLEDQLLESDPSSDILPIALACGNGGSGPLALTGVGSKEGKGKPFSPPPPPSIRSVDDRPASCGFNLVSCNFKVGSCDLDSVPRIPTEEMKQMHTAS